MLLIYWVAEFDKKFRKTFSCCDKITAMKVVQNNNTLNYNIENFTYIVNLYEHFQKVGTAIIAHINEVNRQVHNEH